MWMFWPLQVLFFGRNTCPTSGNRHEQSHCFPRAHIIVAITAP